MSIKDGHMYGALVIGELTDSEIDAILKAAGRVDAGEDGLDLVTTRRGHGEVTFMGDLDALQDALDAMASEADDRSWSQTCHEASKAVHEEFTDTFRGPS